MMASIAYSQHSTHNYGMARELERLGNVATQLTAKIEATFKRWADMHRRAVQDQIFWDLALADRRVMDDLRAMRDRSE